MCDHCPNAKDCAGDIESFSAPTEQVYGYSPMFQQGPTGTAYKRVPLSASDFPEGPVRVEEVCGKRILVVNPKVLSVLGALAMNEIQHYFRKDHLEGWAKILADPDASNNDRFVATQLLKNACIASEGVLPSCQDTGTAIVFAKKGEYVWTNCNDEEELGRGIWEAYTTRNLRYSQSAALTMFKETNTKCNLPAQFDIMATTGNAYNLLFIAKGGGSANKSQLFQQTKALLNPKSLRAFIEEKIKGLGTSACPPYHIALVIGGTSAEQTMKTVKLASCRYLDSLPTTGDASGRAFRDIEWEGIVMDICRSTGIGAQFGGKYLAHQARVIRLPRHGASCPVGLGVSCSADRQIAAKITEDGVFIEELVHEPQAYLPEVSVDTLSDNVVRIDINQPMSAIRAELSKYPVSTRLSLSGTMIVARDMAHAKILERLELGEGLPEYIKDRMVYYAGPAKTPNGYASGSFGPTTAGRMDSYLQPFMAAGGSFISLAKGNRSKVVTEACKQHGGFYLGSIGGPAALLATESIKRVSVLEYPELGMEAVWEIDVLDFPAFIVVDDKGNDFYSSLV